MGNLSCMKPSDYAMGIMVSLTWGMGIVFAKAAIDYFPPMLLMAMRSTLTAFVLIWFMKIPKGSLGTIFLISAISGTAQFCLTLTGLQHVDASAAALLMQLEVPLLVLLGVMLLGERPGLQKWFGIALTFLGALFIAGEPRFAGAWFYIALIIGGCGAWALGQLMVRKLDGIDGLTIAGWVAIFAAPQLFAMSAAFETNQLEAIRSAGWVVWAAVIYLSIVMTVIGYGMWYTLLRRHEIGTVAPFLLLMPVFSVIGGVVFLGEMLTLTTIAGGAVIVLGVYFTMREQAPRPVPAQPRPSAPLCRPAFRS